MGQNESIRTRQLRASRDCHIPRGERFDEPSEQRVQSRWAAPCESMREEQPMHTPSSAIAAKDRLDDGRNPIAGAGGCVALECFHYASGELFHLMLDKGIEDRL